jgi:hypothetical protein
MGKKRQGLPCCLLSADDILPDHNVPSFSPPGRMHEGEFRRLRRVIWLMATGVIINNDLFKTYFKKRTKDGLPYKKAVLATAHKLIRIIFVMLSHRTCFVEGGIKYS